MNKTKASTKRLTGTLAMWLVAMPLLAQSGGTAAEQQHFQYERAITADTGAGPACAVLDATVYAHAAPALKDVRLFRGMAEVPYAMTLSQTTEVSDPARVFNLGGREGRIVFDLQMPQRAYSEVTLDLGGKDFIATADVSGLRSAAGAQTRITRATLFDLSSQRLGRSGTVQVGEANFPVLHVELSVKAAAGTGGGEFTAAMVRGASVPPNREAQTVFTTVAQVSAMTTRGRESVAVFHVPVDVPVERVTFAVPKGFAQSFSRDVTVRAWAEGQAEKDAETVTGTVSVVRVPGESSGDGWVRELSLPATLGANLQRAATVEVAVENGDDAAVPFAGVALEMRQRKICFDGGAATMFYGDGALHAPVYDYARLFAGEAARPAAIGEEMKNPIFVPRADERPYSERHPELLWVVLLTVICLLGVVALRSMKKVQG